MLKTSGHINGIYMIEQMDPPRKKYIIEDDGYLGITLPSGSFYGFLKKGSYVVIDLYTNELIEVFEYGNVGSTSLMYFPYIPLMKTCDCKLVPIKNPYGTIQEEYPKVTFSTSSVIEQFNRLLEELNV